VSETVVCRTCGKDALPDYPHRHETPPRPEYDPMPPKPGKLVDLIAVIRREYWLELPSRLHVQYVPGRLEPIGVSEYSAAAGGYIPGERTVEALDAGALGSPPWAPEAHRRFGGVTVWGDAQTINAADYAIFPWAYAMERRIPGWCRRKHVTRPELYREHRNAPVCGTLVRLVIAADLEVPKAALEQEMTTGRANELLVSALGYLWRCVSDKLNEIDLRRIA
jgi:hypothetical protein